MIRDVLRGLAALPPIRAYRLAQYRDEFFRPGSSWPRFHGLFDTRLEAEAAARGSGTKVGYDHAEVADVSVDAMSTIWTSDYPVLYWLARLTDEFPALFDLGGHIGTKYVAWRDYLRLPEVFRWRVCDLPSIVAAGRERSQEYHPQLSFCTDRHEAGEYKILLASGVLQYGDFDLPETLAGLRSKPTHLLINKVPTHTTQDVYTLENLHHSKVPYRIFNEEHFLEEFQSVGYTVEDRWVVHESSVRVPFSDLGEPVHRGYYLRGV